MIEVIVVVTFIIAVLVFTFCTILYAIDVFTFQKQLKNLFDIYDKEDDI